MRIIAGKYKGRTLKEFDGYDVRPTSDRARESLFNILQNCIYNRDFYDAFAGTGAVGIEALSRGAKRVVFTDVSRESVRLVNENLNKLSIKAEVYNSDVKTFLGREQGKFDIIFIDPPYKTELAVETLSKIVECSSLTDSGIAVVESDREIVFDGLQKYDVRKYGKAIFTFFRRKDNDI